MVYIQWRDGVCNQEDVAHHQAQKLGNATNAAMRLQPITGQKALQGPRSGNQIAQKLYDIFFLG